MSERGAVCSHYFYCQACARATEAVFRKHFEWVTPVMVTQSDQDPYPIIIVGKSRVGIPGEEPEDFERGAAPELAKVLCHPARFAIMGDDQSANAFALVNPHRERVRESRPGYIAGAKVEVREMCDALPNDSFKGATWSGDLSPKP